MKYIDDNKELGILYDWKKIFRLYKKLGCPDNVYNPTALPINQAKYFMLLSERKTGKTTNLLLLGMCANQEYGTVIHYIRQREDMVVNKTIKDLFTTIRQYGYIEKITKGKYNDVVYKSRRWYYCNIDDNGICEIAPTHFMYCCSIDKAFDLKSSYSSPLGDFIIFDEFISPYYYPNEFVSFEDLCDTIIRKRKSPIIFLLSNTIDKHSQYFNEFCVYDEIQRMNIGDKEIVETDMGTRVYVEIIKLKIDNEQSAEKKEHNKLFYGFSNPQLNSITGVEWATKSYPHINPEWNNDIIINNYYLKYNTKLLKLDIVQNEIGICVLIHRATKTYNDSIIYTIGDIDDNRYRFKFGNNKIDALIWKLYKANKFYYADNSCGTIVNNYIKQAIKIKGL